MGGGPTSPGRRRRIRDGTIPPRARGALPVRKEETYPVSGTVTLDGAPLADGDIHFLTRETAALDVIPIKDGKFEGRAKAGKRRLETKAYREEQPAAGEPTMPGADQPTRVNYIPKQYNTESKLTEEVTPDGPNQFTFELESGEPAGGGAAPGA